MKIAYLLNSYPMTSTTFIRREIQALVADGVEVSRFAVRHWDQALVDSEDIEEQRRTHYLLTGNVPRMLLAFFSELLRNPVGVWRAAAALMSLYKTARGGLVRHFAYLLQAAYFKQCTETQNIQHVHAHFATNATAVALLARLMGGPSYSFTSHGPEEFDEAKYLSFDLKMRHAEFIAAISNFCRVQLVRASRFDYWNKIHIVHCGLRIADFTVDDRCNDANQTFVNIARFNAQKGLWLIPPALALLRSEFPQAKVILIGDGEERASLEATIADHAVADMIELRGWQPNFEVRKALVESRALLLPSFAEGLPVVIMESFALGRPVIATYIAGIPELVDPACGWLVPAGSIEALADAMRNALRAGPDVLRAMGQEGRRRCVAQHDVATSAVRLKALFRVALDKAS